MKRIKLIVVMLGTGEHRENVKTVLTELANNAVNDKDQVVLLIDGPGGASKNNKTEHPMLGNYTAAPHFDPNTHTLIIEKIVKPYAQTITQPRGIVFGDGYKDAIQEVNATIEELIIHGYTDFEIDYYGFSRGADCCLRSDNSTNETFTPVLYPGVKITSTICAIDPVPGPGRNDDRKACTVSPHVTRLDLHLMNQEGRDAPLVGEIFRVQDKSRVVVQNQPTKVNHYHYNGNHSDATRYSDHPNNLDDPCRDAPALLWTHVQEHAHAVGTKLKSKLNYTAKIEGKYETYPTDNSVLDEDQKLLAYCRMVYHTDAYAKKANGKRKRAHTSQKHTYFLHGHDVFADKQHMDLFRNKFPYYFDYYFQYDSLSRDSNKERFKLVFQDLAKISKKKNEQIKSFLERAGYNTKVDRNFKPRGFPYSVNAYDDDLKPLWEGLQSALKPIWNGKDKSFTTKEAEEILDDAFKILSGDDLILRKRVSVVEIQAELKKFILEKAHELKSKNKIGITYTLLTQVGEENIFAKTVKHLDAFDKSLTEIYKNLNLDRKHKFSHRFEPIFAKLTDKIVIVSLDKNLSNDQNNLKIRKIINKVEALVSTTPEFKGHEKKLLRHIEQLKKDLPISAFDILTKECDKYLAKPNKAKDHHIAVMSLKNLLNTIDQYGGAAYIHLLPAIRTEFNRAVKQTNDRDLKYVSQVLTQFSSSISAESPKETIDAINVALEQFKNQMKTMTSSLKTIIDDLEKYLEVNSDYSDSCNEYKLAQKTLALVKEWTEEQIVPSNAKETLKMALAVVNFLEVNKGLEKILKRLALATDDNNNTTHHETLNDSADIYVVVVSNLVPQPNMASQHKKSLEELYSMDDKNDQADLKPDEAKLLQHLNEFYDELNAIDDGHNINAIYDAYQIASDYIDKNNKSTDVSKLKQWLKEQKTALVKLNLDRIELASAPSRVVTRLETKLTASAAKTAAFVIAGISLAILAGLAIYLTGGTALFVMLGAGALSAASISAGIGTATLTGVGLYAGISLTFGAMTGLAKKAIDSIAAIFSSKSRTQNRPLNQAANQIDDFVDNHAVSEATDALDKEIKLDQQTLLVKELLSPANVRRRNSPTSTPSPTGQRKTKTGAEGPTIVSIAIDLPPNKNDDLTQITTAPSTPTPIRRGAGTMYTSIKPPVSSNNDALPNETTSDFKSTPVETKKF